MNQLIKKPQLDIMHICTYNNLMKFEWDKKKAKANIKKHGVRFSDASQVFEDDFALTKEDDSSENEQRWVTLGLTDEGCLVVVWTERTNAITRIISARNATAHEKKTYQKEVMR